MYIIIFNKKKYTDESYICIYVFKDESKETNSYGQDFLILKFMSNIKESIKSDYSIKSDDHTI